MKSMVYFTINKSIMIKIAFGYKQRVGKDTACDYLTKHYGGIKLSFSEPLYCILNFAQNICGFDQSKDRRFLQFVGTEWARTINDKVWIELMIEKIKDNVDQNIFISDLRFKNEAKVLKDLGFVCVEIRNKNVLDDYSDHNSNKDLDGFDGWDYTITNFNTIKNFYDQLDQLYTVVKSNDQVLPIIES